MLKLSLLFKFKKKYENKAYWLNCCITKNSYLGRTKQAKWPPVWHACFNVYPRLPFLGVIFLINYTPSIPKPLIQTCIGNFFSLEFVLLYVNRMWQQTYSLFLSLESKKVLDSRKDANNGITMKTMIEQSYDGSNNSNEYYLQILPPLSQYNNLFGFI